MASEKISQMPAISSFATGDLLAIVDVSEFFPSDRNKSVTFGELFRNVLGGTAAAPSIAFTGDQNTGIYSPGADQVSFTTGGSQRLLIDSSGQIEAANLGSASAPAWSFVGDPNTGIYSPGADQLAISTTTSAAPLTVNGVVEANGSNYRAVFGNGYLDGDSTGATGGSAAEVQIQSASSSRPATLSLGGGQGSGENLGVITFFNSNNTDGKRLRASITAGQEGATANAQGGLLAFSTTADGASSPTERMRIGQNGNVSIGTTGSTVRLDVLAGSQVATRIVNTSTDDLIAVKGNSGGSSGSAMYVMPMRFGDDTLRGSIYWNGSTVAYNTTSDYRLKENITPYTGALDKLSQLKPVTYNFLDKPNTVLEGFIAHEVQDVVPNAVSGVKDEEDSDGKPLYQGLDTSKLVPLLTAALQEAIAKIETLEAKVAALEAA